MNKYELAKKINELDGLTNEEKSELLKLLRSQKKYGLVWEDKPEDAELRMVDEMPVLEEVPERAIVSDAPDAPNHVLIEGDNLEALTALTYTHTGKIDVIYIDPPYNTGNKDFVYNDSFVDRENGYRHSMWLSFMNKRLKIAKSLLSEKGVIFISIDDNEQAQLKMLCDEIFGLNNYEATITYVRKTLGKQDSANFAKSTEYILVYSKSANWVASSLPAEEKVTERYNKIDSQGRRYRETDLRKTGNADRRSDRPLMFYPFYFNPASGELLVRAEHNEILEMQGYVEIYPVKPDGTDGRWRWARNTSEENIKSLVAKEMAKYKGKYTVYEKDYIDKKEEKRTVTEHTSWDRKAFNSDNAMMDFKELGFGNQDFPFPKSTDLIQHIVFLSNKRDGVFLDFFAGSGTTMQALIRQNAEDGGHRQCILATNNENGICENVTYERNRRVIQGYTTPKGENVPGLTHNNLRYYKTKLLPRQQTVKNKRALVSASTDLLCIKNNVYTEQTWFAGRKLKPSCARYFDNGETKMLVIYNELTVDAFAETIYNMDVEGKILIYVFSNTRYAYDDNFEDVLDKVELCALPAAIYDAYRNILPEENLMFEEPLDTEENVDGADVAENNNEAQNPNTTNEGQLSFDFQNE
jgi:adenine-specific DNA-methyltransferase